MLEWNVDIRDTLPHFADREIQTLVVEGGNGRFFLGVVVVVYKKLSRGFSPFL